MTLRKPLVDATSPIEIPDGDYLESDVGLIKMKYNEGLRENLINAWLLDETSGTRSAFIGSHDLSDGNTVGYETGKISNAAKFTKADKDRLYCSDHADLRIDDSKWHIAFWVRLNDVSAEQYIMGKGDSNLTHGYDWIIWHDGSHRFYFSLKTPYANIDQRHSVKVVCSPSNGDWFFVSASIDFDANEQHIDVNNTGSPGNYSYPFDSVYDRSGPFQVGGWTAAGGGGTDISVDCVYMWKDRILTADELTYLYNNGNGSLLPDIETFPICTPVYPGDSNKINKAKADASTTSHALGLVLDSDDAVVQTDGVLTATTAQWDAVVTGASGGLTANTVYFLDAVNAGKLTPTAPTTAGKLVARVGKAVSATQLQINIKSPILL